MRNMPSHWAARKVMLSGLLLTGAILLYACAAPPTATPTAVPTATLPPATPTAVAAAAGTATVAATTPTAVSATSAPVGIPAEGLGAMVRFNCGSCHTIPGVPGANGTDAPSLAGYGSMPLILGRVPNTLDNTARFIENPQQVVPGATMPNLNVPAPAAQHMAAYLETLK